MNSWKLKKLSEVCDFVGGSQPPKSDFSSEEKEGYIRLIQIRDYKSDDNIVYIPKAKARRFCDENDIMIGRYGPPVFQILKGLKGAYNVALMKAIPDERVLLKDYTFLFLKYSEIQDFIINISHRAAGQTGVNKEALEGFPILVPPLDEQERIVSIVGRVLSAIDQAKENVQRNLQNAKELFQSELNSIFANKGEDWEGKTLEEVTTKIGSGATPRGGNESYKAEGISLIRSMNVHDRYFKNNNLAYIDDVQAKALSNVTLEEDDVLFNITGASIARCCVIPKSYLPARVNQHVSIIRVKKDMVIPYFMNLLLTADIYKNQLLQTGEQGSTRQAVTKAQLLNFLVSLPPLQKQKQIIIQLDTLSAETKQLEALYQQKLHVLEELKKSILQKAFSGELIEAKELVA